MSQKREITRDDIMPMEQYVALRKDHRRSLIETKRKRRIDVGPVATFYFENYDTMWAQVHEMLYIERGGEDQIPDELAAYNPLIPKGRELVATVMFEIDDPVRRKALLSRLGGIEETAFLEFGGHHITSVAEADVDRTTADGKASSVQFLHFPMTDAEASDFRKTDARVLVGFAHPNYAHMAVMPEDMRAALAEDLD